MDHGSDIGLVDAHAKGDGRNDHLQIVVLEGALHPIARVGGHTGVICRRREDLVQLSAEGLRFLASRRVDDRRSPVGILQNTPYQDPSYRRPCLHNLHSDVGAPKAVDEVFHIWNRELLDDVPLYQRRSGCGEGDDRRRAEHR